MGIKKEGGGSGSGLCESKKMTMTIGLELSSNAIHSEEKKGL